MVMATARNVEAPIDSACVSAYRVPTESPEQDGTFDWDSTTIVLVELSSGEICGLGFTYADLATAQLIEKMMLPVVSNRNAMDIPAIRDALVGRIRNLGRPGISSMALSAVDTALWDLKSKLLDLPLADLLGRCRPSVAIYGSGGFTNYTSGQLTSQLEGWLKQGIERFKIKIGRDPQHDLARLKQARSIIGPEAQLFVDANGAYQAREALQQAQRFAEFDVSWFEEPVSSDDLEGLHRVRERAPQGMNIAAGEYGYTPEYFARMLSAQAVDVLQADATRCGGVSGFLDAAALCRALHFPLSAHTAPAIHAQIGVAASSLIHLEYFFDHARIENMFFDGVIQPVDGRLEPSRDRPGLGLELKRQDVERWMNHRSA